MLPYLVPLIVFGLMWAVLIRPQQNRMRQRAQLIDSVDVGHRVVTAGGIHGVVRSVDDDVLSVEVAPGVEMTIDRRAVASVPTLEEQGLTEPPVDDSALNDREEGMD